ncbi:MAG TPA: alpha/beta fold hydrolase [Ktedonobacteraceae bacterium]
MPTTNIPVKSRHTAKISGTTVRPQWLDKQLYPFESRFVEVEGNHIHYIDEGTGPTLLLLHPGVGWSFMYSDIIQELRSRFRCVALDLPGFGLSPAEPGYQHTLIGDSRLLERFISTLGLSEVTLFSHDVTGSIALGVVARRPEWFRAVIVLPSFAWPLESYRKVYAMIQLMGSPMFRFLSYHFNFFLEYTLRTITKKPKQPFSDPEKLAYRGPNLDRAVRRYPHDLFKSVTKSHDYLADLEQRLSAISAPIRPANVLLRSQAGRAEKEMPALLIFAEDGTIEMGWLSRFEQLFPLHRSVVMQGSHHFPQVYDSQGVATAIRRWWDEEIE